MTDLVLQALREIVPVTRGRLNLGGRMLRWVESGTGAPAVILIAGRNDTALSWGPVLAALAGRTRAVAYDRAGLGDSDPDPKILSAERTVADLSRLINVVSAGRCVVAGHSYGGLLALMLAAAHLDQLSGLVLVDPALPGLMDWLPRPPRVQALVTDAYLACADWPHALASYREGQGIVASERSIRRSLAAPVNSGLPTAVISATEGGPSRIRRRWTALHAALAAERGATHIIAEGSGHAVPLDRPVLVAETILGLTRALPPQ